MRHIFVAITLIATLSIVPALASDVTSTPVAANPDGAIKCRKVEVTGSLVRKGRVCKTVAEWKQIQDNGNRTARAITESGRICAGGACGNGN